jgi:DNA-binding Lrp family transcriptional regulator
MVAIAFLLINADLGAEDKVLSEMRKIANVKEAYVTYGVYDIVARVEAESFETLRKIITSKVRRLGNVLSTLTTMVVEES